MNFSPGDLYSARNKFWYWKPLHSKLARTILNCGGDLVIDLSHHSRVPVPMHGRISELEMNPSFTEFEPRHHCD